MKDCGIEPMLLLINLKINKMLSNIFQKIKNKYQNFNSLEFIIKKARFYIIG